MAVPVSSLSVAIQGIADFLDGEFGEDVVITVDTPQRANDTAKAGTKHVLNLFVYRVAPSGFHASSAMNETNFIRANVLITPFLSGQNDETETDPGDSDLRILGHLIRVFQSKPVVPGIAAVLPGSPVAAEPLDFRHQQHLDYRLQAILQTPTMEELNHIWTTQGGDLAYRLSAAYEFALIPIEPLELREDPPPMTTAILDVALNVDGGRSGGFIAYSDETSAIPVAGIGAEDTPVPTNWLPVLLLADGSTLTNSKTVSAGTAKVEIALAGPQGERVALEVAWNRSDGTEETQAAQVFPVQTHLIDDASARLEIDLDSAAAGDSAIIYTRPVDALDQPYPTSPFANTLSLEVSA